MMDKAGKEIFLGIFTPYEKSGTIDGDVGGVHWPWKLRDRVKPALLRSICSIIKVGLLNAPRFNALFLINDFCKVGSLSYVTRQQLDR